MFLWRFKPESMHCKEFLTWVENLHIGTLRLKSEGTFDSFVCYFKYSVVVTYNF